MNNEPHRVIIKQTFVSKCDEKIRQNLKNFNPKITAENSRLLRSDGTVIKIMNDGGVEVYHANGVIFRKELETINNKNNDTIQVENIEIEMNIAKSKGSMKDYN